MMIIMKYKYYLISRGFGGPREWGRSLVGAAPGPDPRPSAHSRRHQTCDFREHAFSCLLHLQSSEGKLTMSRETEPVCRSFCRHGSGTFTEVARLVPFWPLCVRASPPPLRARRRGVGQPRQLLGLDPVGHVALVVEPPCAVAALEARRRLSKRVDGQVDRSVQVDKA